jgi:hypothetical protein
LLDTVNDTMSDDLSPDPHGYFDLLKAAEQLSKNDESSQKLAERLLKVCAIFPFILVSSLADFRQKKGSHGSPMCLPGTLPHDPH